MVISVSSYKAGSSSDESERLNWDSSVAAAAQRASLSALCASHDIHHHKARVAWSGPSSMGFSTSLLPDLFALCTDLQCLCLVLQKRKQIMMGRSLLTAFSGCLCRVSPRPVPPGVT